MGDLQIAVLAAAPLQELVLDRRSVSERAGVLTFTVRHVSQQFRPTRDRPNLQFATLKWIGTFEAILPQTVLTRDTSQPTESADPGA